MRHQLAYERTLYVSYNCIHRGSALQRRLTDREVEETADKRDRQKELEHLDSTRRKLLEEEDPNAETIIFKMEQAMQEHLRKRLDLDARSPVEDANHRSTSESRGGTPEPHSMSGFVEATAVSFTATSFLKLCEYRLPPNEVSAFQVSSGGFKPVSPENESKSIEATPKGVSGSETSQRDSSTFLFSMASSKSAAFVLPVIIFNLLKFITVPV